EVRMRVDGGEMNRTVNAAVRHAGDELVSRYAEVARNSNDVQMPCVCPVRGPRRQNQSVDACKPLVVSGRDRRPAKLPRVEGVELRAADGRLDIRHLGLETRLHDLVTPRTPGCVSLPGVATHPVQTALSRP